MAPLTWREVSAPNFSGVTDARRLAAQLMNSGFGAAREGLSEFERSRTANADRDFLSQISQYTDPNALQQALKSGTIYDGVNRGHLSPDAIKYGIGMQDDLLQNQGNQLLNQGRVLSNDQTAWANNRTREFSDLSLEAAQAGAEDSRYTRANTEAARGLISSLAPGSIDQTDLLRKLRAADASPDVIARAVGMAESQGGAIYGPAADLGQITMDQTLAGLNDRYEGGGDYNATLDNGRWTNGPQNLVGMTIKQIRQLQDSMRTPENRAKYGNGKGSSALGRHQIVSSTLDELIKEMGLTGDELFDEAMQDRMFVHLADRRLDRATTMEGKRAQLRMEWEGYKNASNDELDAAIRAYERGDKGALTGAGPASGSQDPASTASSEIAQAAGVNRDLLNKEAELQSQAQTLMDAATADAAFDQNFPILSTLMDPEGKSKTSSDVAKDLQQHVDGAGDISLGQLTTDINKVMRENGVSADVAGAAISNAISETNWTNWWPGMGARYVPHEIVNEQLRRFIDPESGQPLQGTMEQIEVRRAKQADAAQIQELNTQVAQAKQEYANALARQRDGRKVDVSKPRQKYETLLARLEIQIAAANERPTTRANTSSLTGR